MKYDFFSKYISYSPDTGKLKWLGNGPIGYSRMKRGKLGSENGKGSMRVRVRVIGRKYYYHRIAWLLHHGSIDRNKVIDHIDGNPLNNKIINLRMVKGKINAQNIKGPKKGNKSGFLGVVRSKAKAESWESSIRLNGKYRYLGAYPTRELAHEAYLKARRSGMPGNTL